jgi:hypothetical protein
VRPYSNQTVVARPAGLTVPVTVAEDGPIAVSGPVATAGSDDVPNLTLAPRKVPTELRATRRTL